MLNANASLLAVVRRCGRLEAKAHLPPKRLNNQLKLQRGSNGKAIH